LRPWGSAKCPIAAGNSGCPVIEHIFLLCHCCSFVPLPICSGPCLFDASLLHDAVSTPLCFVGIVGYGIKLNGCVHALQILNGGAPCQQIDSEEEDEQEAEADDEVSARIPCVPCHSIWQCSCCAVLCCAVLCCAVLCCAVLCCAMLCHAVWSPSAHFWMESLLHGLAVRAKLAVHDPSPLLAWQVTNTSKVSF